eukprot:m.272337 g.272337  ORF g.272337 m.272337 type:complete len:60 (-) comp90603_c0_seq1:178-357(-)
MAFSYPFLLFPLSISDVFVLDLPVLFSKYVGDSILNDLDLVASFIAVDHLSSYPSCKSS